MNDYLTIHDEPFFVIGKPLETKYGVIKPVKVKDYANASLHLKFLEMPEWEVKEYVLKRVANTQYKDFVERKFEHHTLLTCIQENVIQLREYYEKLFKDLILDYDEDAFIFQFTTMADFENFRRLLLKFNGIEVEESNPNPEIRKFQLFKKKMDEVKGGSIDFETAYTSLMVMGSLSSESINEMTMYQFYKAFERLVLAVRHEDTMKVKTTGFGSDIEVVDAFKRLSKEEDGHYYEAVEQLKQGNVFLKKK